MATVRFSDSLKDSVRKSAKDMFSDKIKQAVQDVPAHWADKVYECLFPVDVRMAMSKLPPYVLSTQECIESSGFANAPDDVWQTGAYSHKVWRTDGGAIRLSFNAPMPWVNRFKEAPTGFAMDYSMTGKFDYNDARWDWLKPEFKEYNRKVFEQTDKMEKFLTSVNTLMDTYTTLAPALKAWRPLWELLPEEAKERHKTIKERKVTKAEDLNLDLNSMTSAVTLSKITK